MLHACLYSTESTLIGSPSLLVLRCLKIPRSVLTFGQPFLPLLRGFVFTCPMWDAPISLWRQNWHRYNTVLGSKHDELPDLEQFVFSTLSSLATSRDEPHITRAEYVKLVSWKLKRGKARPFLQSYANALSENDVVFASNAAINDMQEDDPMLALKPLLKLRGCGPATASALLAALSPSYPFMSDELLATTLGTLKYTVSVRCPSCVSMF